MKNITPAKLARIREIPLRPALEYYGLQFNGHSFALCPFHAEDTPSFLCRPKDARWKCFGCGESGDLIDFARRYLGLSFGDAVDRISRDWHMGDERPTPAELRALDERKILAANRKRARRRAEEDYLNALDGWLTSVQKLALAKSCDPMGRYKADLYWNELKARFALEMAETARIQKEVKDNDYD